MTINYIKPLVACYVTLLVLCGYLVFQIQLLQRPNPPSSLHDVASAKEDAAQLPPAGQVEHQSSFVNESSVNATMQGLAVDTAASAEGESIMGGMQLGSSRDEELVSQ
ncbi:MAG: hypothetical protein ACJAYF_000527 [Arenicella sp.]|jgi:hypothetical protein